MDYDEDSGFIMRWMHHDATDLEQQRRQMCGTAGSIGTNEGGWSVDEAETVSKTCVVVSWRWLEKEGAGGLGE